ncbi:DEAD-domain-containing protein [Fomitiporia mediterranea MF3/22]|uniref:DEAD-domain-containing protein n=1 Tax=Fomitiporia mediterranea (strain MF3/22) TaxID=694068 RepID=UPI0004409CB0|nr:DEAD-domain-containing protein [Fomitiporia mediterranea MF3/22]EJC98248.1 DEAD-domain-containing protein [Fomitiporia mediterranea MF3/22]
MSLLVSKRALKRKKPSSSALGSRKRLRRDVNSIEDLPWKKVSRPSALGFEGDDGILELEEVEDVEVVYEETKNGRVARFKVLEDQEHERGSVSHEDDDERTNGDPVVEEDVFDLSLLPEWSDFSLHARLLSALHSQKFATPTPIQRSAIPVALKGKDVVGVAQTGSGKTLAYGLPILNHLLQMGRPKGKRPLQALVLAPTRELALQVTEHLKACVVEDAERRTGAPRVSIGTVVGGMAIQKQIRIIERGVDILVATPGRLWDLIEEDNSLSEQLRTLRFLVLDEADRMIETGHFAELDNIIRLTTRQSKSTETDEAFMFGETETRGKNDESNEETPMQTFIFSATLSRDLQQNLKKWKRISNKVTKKGTTDKPVSTLDELLSRLDFRDPEPEVIDLSPEGGIVSTLKESQVECLSADKDVYLYYFLLRYPGRSLVFLSSIDGIRRLLPLCELLQLHAFPLHSQLQQRQRLKNLDRFKSTANSILLATDVAARGLDIPSVDHVIHYQIPRSADVYIHRNGRTARASRHGFSLIMCAPDERRILRALHTSLNRVGENEIPDMPIELDLLDKLKGRVQLAKRIDAAAHRVKKEKHERNWMKETAEAMEIELDSDMDDKLSDGDAPSKKRKDSKVKQETQALKAELKHMLSQPLVAKGVMKKYITSGARSVVSELLNSKGDDEMLGYRRAEARDDLVNTKSSADNKQRPKKSEVEEEWTGFE